MAKDGSVIFGTDIDDSGARKGLQRLGGAVAKAAGATFAVAGAAAIALGKQIVTAYADYEQLVGGVDTLFKGASATVQEYAANAYKTAGLSANQYMETVTGFSASLIQSLGGDTDKAAKYADMAITDMSDNANKMGTSMDSIQYAYQGFAKQNYTMLDNLKLGYGGTKQEMQRLLKDAGKIAGTKFDISSYADVAEAIHVIQTEMGITGTTALEAEHTITGSMGALKAALGNLLVGFGDANADFTGLSQIALDAFQTVLTNLAPVVQNIVAALPEALGGMFSAVNAMLPTYAPQLVQLAVGIITAFVAGIKSNATAVAKGLGDALMQAVSGIAQILPDVLSAVLTMMLEIGKMLADQAPEIIPEIIDALLAVLLDIAENADQLADVAVALITGIMDGLNRAVPAILRSAPAIIGKIATAFINAIPAAFSAFGNGIIDIINSIFGSNIPHLEDIKFPTWEEISTAVSTWWTDLAPKLSAVLDWALGALGLPEWSVLQADVAAWWVSFKASLADALDWVLGALGLPAWSELSAQIATWWDTDIAPELLKALDWALGLLGLPSAEEITESVRLWWDGIRGQLAEIVTIAVGIKLPTADEVMQQLNTDQSGGYNGTSGLGEALINALFGKNSTVRAKPLTDGISADIAGTEGSLDAAKTTLKEKAEAVKAKVQEGLAGGTDGTAWASDYGTNVVGALATGLTTDTDADGSPSAAAEALHTDVVAKITNDGDTSQELAHGSAMAGAIASGINKDTSVKKKLAGVITSATDAAKTSGYLKSYPIGTNIVDGIVAGINDHGFRINNALSGAVSSALLALMHLLGIESPSKLFRDMIGKNMALGIGVGFDAAFAGVTGDMAQRIAQSAAAGQRAINNTLLGRVMALETGNLPSNATIAAALGASSSAAIGVNALPTRLATQQTPSVVQHITFAQPMQAPYEIARRLRNEATFGLGVWRT